MSENTKYCERSSLDRIMNLQLPSKWRRIGVYALIASFAALVINKLTLDSQIFREVYRVTFQLALVVIAFSKEKIEDELIQKMRLQSFYVAFLTGTFYVVVLPYVGLLLDHIMGVPNPHKEPLSSFLIIAQFVGVQIMCFEILKRRYR